jgi:uncharacterized membrane protein SirB2
MKGPVRPAACRVKLEKKRTHDKKSWHLRFCDLSNNFIAKVLKNQTVTPNARRFFTEAETMSIDMFEAPAYLQLKAFHQLAVALSLSLFALRWVGVLANARWPMRKEVRITSVAIDSLLLGAGAGLWWMGGWNPLHNPWLGTKLLLLVVYILMGTWALKRAHSRMGHTLFGLLALAIAGYMVGVALQHHPASWFYGLLQGNSVALFLVPATQC